MKKRKQKIEKRKEPNRKKDSREQALREQVAKLLDWEDAHVSYARALGDFPPSQRGEKPPGAAHTAWQLLEHMRLAQWDILEFSRNPKHVSPEFPAGYWPQTPAPPDTLAWDRSVGAFRTDLAAMQKLVRDPKRDLLAPIAHGQGQTILREALLLADHNAYHLGQLVLLRRLLRVWKE